MITKHFLCFNWMILKSIEDFLIHEALSKHLWRWPFSPHAPICFQREWCFEDKWGFPKSIGCSQVIFSAHCMTLGVRNRQNSPSLFTMHEIFMRNTYWRDWWRSTFSYKFRRKINITILLFIFFIKTNSVFTSLLIINGKWSFNSIFYIGFCTVLICFLKWIWQIRYIYTVQWRI